MTEAYLRRLAEAADAEYYRTADEELRGAIAERARLLRELSSVVRFEEAARGRAEFRYSKAREMASRR